MRYQVTEELKSPVRVYRGIHLSDFLFFLAYAGVIYATFGMVHTYLKAFYLIFAIVAGIFLIVPSGCNKKRRMWQAMLLYFRKDTATYPSIPPVEATETPVYVGKKKERGSVI